MSEQRRQEDQFTRLARSDCFGDTTPEQAADLRSPANLLRFHIVLTTLTRSLTEQLGRGYSGTGTPDEAKDWERRVTSLKSRVDARLVELDALLDAETARLRGAIENHRTSTTIDGVAPTAADSELWAVLEPTPAPADDEAEVPA